MNEISKGKYFTVLADEAADCSNIEQLSLVIRYVDGQCKLKKHFIRFFCKEGIAGEALASLILDTIMRYGLEADFLRGQGYDGAGNMAGNLRVSRLEFKQSFPRQCMYIVHPISLIWSF